MQVGGGGERSLKRRPLTEMDNQHHLTLRTVKQRLMQHTSPISPLAFSIPTSPDSPIPTTTMSRLQQIEDQLLNDIEDDSPANQNSEWSESTLQSLIEKPSLRQSLIKKPSLRQSLLHAAYALSEGDPDFASAVLAHLTSAADPRGDPEQRLAHHMSSALLSRLSAEPIDIGTSHSLQHHHHHAFPSFDLCFVAANRAILDSSSKARPNLHIVDFDVGDGAQYVSLIESLPHPRPSSITITACAVSELPQSHPPETVGDRLVSLGERAGVAVRFNVVRCKASELDRKVVGLNDEEETVAVNFAYALQRVADESVTTENPRDVLLRRVRGELRPDVVVLVEENLNTNTAPFAVRFGEVMGHVGSVFGSLEARMGRESAERERVEEWLGMRARDMVAAEGPNRVCRCEVFGKWRARLGMAGYRQRQFGPGVAESVRERIGSGLVGPGLTFKEMDGGLCFGWGDRVLTVVSTWH
ncbi:Scarecrow-like protein 8 [Acorus gramineus]|uniref:Scarecrow-like protein 8 n=1 Tax=Acorus gramineus TaxID=55184 RepID=A0AAV9BBQ3_ACOGR|nr:Scarecrow-like protein 8 [Acorus gramineus]